MSTNSKSSLDTPLKSLVQEKEVRDDNVDSRTSNSLNKIILTPITPSNNFLSLHNICNIIQQSPIESQRSTNGSISRKEDIKKSEPLGNAHNFNVHTSISTASTEDHKFINDDDNTHRKEERETKSSYPLNWQEDTKEVYSHTFGSMITHNDSRVKPLEPMAAAATRCSNPLCLQCRFVQHNLSQIQSTSNYPSTSGIPFHYYLALPNPQASFYLPSSAYKPTQLQPQLPQGHKQKNEHTSTAEEKTICNECITQMNVQSQKRRRRKVKAMVYSVDESTIRSGEICCCSNCGVSESPAWRRDLQGDALLCNACGLYLKVKGRPRPFEIGTDGEIRLARSGRIGVGQKCQNCGTSETPCWRGPVDGKLCNRCGLFFRQHGYHRPRTTKFTRSRSIR
ncbi:2806_t:CDS:2 [Funneliformis mosseae]|uniref:2806_t:CDS:1 n=1 Tax=Funneliformis mosseae TaxID=27381 RepID=A0A9N8ZDM9_FUNMO|nr:2806_t:CDS:2 [Funneliformis mosseae]